MEFKLQLAGSNSTETSKLKLELHTQHSALSTQHFFFFSYGPNRALRTGAGIG